MPYSQKKTSRALKNKKLKATVTCSSVRYQMNGWKGTSSTIAWRRTALMVKLLCFWYFVCLGIFGSFILCCQYQCSWLPGKTVPEMTYYVSRGTLSICSLTQLHDVYDALLVEIRWHLLMLCTCPVQHVNEPNCIWYLLWSILAVLVLWCQKWLTDLGRDHILVTTFYCYYYCYYYHIHLTAFFQDNLDKRHQKGKSFWILLEQEMMGWQWHQLDHLQIICISLQTDNHTGYCVESPLLLLLSCFSAFLSSHLSHQRD